MREARMRSRGTGQREREPTRGASRSRRTARGCHRVSVARLLRRRPGRPWRGMRRRIRRQREAVLVASDGCVADQTEGRAMNCENCGASFLASHACLDKLAERVAKLEARLDFSVKQGAWSLSA